MQLNQLTTTNIRRYSSLIYIVKELLDKSDYDDIPTPEIIDTLLIAFYGFEDLITELNKSETRSINQGQHNE